MRSIIYVLSWEYFQALIEIFSLIFLFSCFLLLFDRLGKADVIFEYRLASVQVQKEKKGQTSSQKQIRTNRSTALSTYETA